MITEHSGLSASGLRIFDVRMDHWTASLEKIVRLAPTSAPVIAWVVETGSPVAVATMTQPKAPASTATKNTTPGVTPAVSRPLLNFSTRSAPNQNENAAPAAVVTGAQRSAFLGVVSP